jgi:sulfite reductase (NADPH) flavoprotein alpha-component
MSGDLRQNFTGRHLVNTKLTGSGSEKDTRHHEISIDSGPVRYLPGDALGVHPRNSPALVEAILRAIRATGDEPVQGPDAASMPSNPAPRSLTS